MKSVSRIATLSLLAALTLGLGAAAAQDSPLQFLHALQEHGYGDMAVQYMKSLEKQLDRLPELQEVWDLEMSKSYRAAAADAFDENEKEQLMAESQRYSEKFIKEKPEHPEAAAAMAGSANFLTSRALQLIRQAKNAEATDKDQRDNYLADARASLADARMNIEQAQKMFKDRLAEPAPGAKAPSKKPTRRDTTADAREQAEANLQEAQYQLALLDYYVAQTYPDPKSADHIAALKRAANALDVVFQRERIRPGGITDVGLYAHLWHGKACEELGDLQTAMDIFDEVLASAPEPSETSQATGLEPLFAQAEYFRLMLLARQAPKDFQTEAAAWLKSYSRFKQTDGYQGVSLEVAKALAAKAAKAAPSERTRLAGEAIRTLNEVVKVRSPYQPEAVRLLHDLKLAASDQKSDSGKVEANSFDEAVGMGDVCATRGQWSKAVEWYALAMKLVAKLPPKDRDPTRIDAVREAGNGAQFMVARDLFNKGKLNECIEMANKLVRDDGGNVKKTSAAAAQAAALAVTAALDLYLQAPAEDKKAAALEKLMTLAEFTEKNWPDRPEADDSRMARGQAKLVAGEWADAIAIFERVNPKSERYPTAAYMAGKAYALRYIAEKAKPETARNNPQMASDLAKAIERVQSGLEIFKAQVEAGRPLPKYYMEMQLLLAEIRNEGGQHKEAVALYQPMIDMIEAEKPQTLDATTLRIFLGAVRAYSALGQLDKAGKVSTLLIDLGPDTLEVNAGLIEFAKLLNLECKKASAVVTELESAKNDEELNKAKVRLASLQELLGKILLKLADRREVSLAGMMFLGETLNSLGMTAQAGGELQKILDRAKTDKDFAKAAEKAMPRIRTELLKTLRERGKFDEALAQVDQLIKEHPNALDPLMEKGKILEAWAEKDPTKFDDAVAHWAMVRNRLQPLANRPGCPAEYFDVMYNVAKCLVREAQQSKDKTVVLDRAKKAEQVLKAPLILNPTLNGPDMVAKYKVLLNQAIALQGRSPDQNGAKKNEKKS
jgi:tetratricopeptide (TPR) repeat protein